MNTSSNFKLIDGIPGWGQGVNIVTAELQEDRIVFTKTVVRNSPTVSLMFDQITETSVYSEKELIEKSKSVIGRAAIGSLFGPLGSIIGAISGTGKKSRFATNTFYTISYTSSDGSPAMITLMSGVTGCHLMSFDSALSAKLPSQNKNQNTFL